MFSDFLVSCFLAAAHSLKLIYEINTNLQVSYHYAPFHAPLFIDFSSLSILVINVSMAVINFYNC